MKDLKFKRMMKFDQKAHYREAMKWTYFWFQAAKLNLRKLAMKPLIGDNNTFEFRHLEESLTKPTNCIVSPNYKNYPCSTNNTFMPGNSTTYCLMQCYTVEFKYNDQIYNKTKTRSGLSPGLTDLSNVVLTDNKNKKDKLKKEKTEH